MYFRNVLSPTIETNLDILILNHQINDFGYLFKSINLKACYDSLALEQQNEPSIASKTSKYHRLFYTLSWQAVRPSAWINGDSHFALNRSGNVSMETFLNSYWQLHLNPKPIVKVSPWSLPERINCVKWGTRRSGCFAVLAWLNTILSTALNDRTAHTFSVSVSPASMRKNEDSYDDLIEFCRPHFSGRSSFGC